MPPKGSKACKGKWLKVDKKKPGPRGRAASLSPDMINTGASTDGASFSHEGDLSPAQLPVTVPSNVQGSPGLWHPEVADINVDLVNQIVTARQKLLDHPALTDLATAEPLGLSKFDNGPMQHYRPKYDFFLASSQIRTYGKTECNVNLFMLNWFGSVAKMAPVSLSKLARIKSLVKLEADEWNAENLGLIVAVKDTENLTAELASCTSISPIEFIWGPLLVYADHLNKAPTDDEVANIRRALLTVKCSIVLDTDPMRTFWNSFEFRARTKQAGEASDRTAVQSMYDVWESKTLLDKKLGHSLGAEATANYWQTQVDKEFKMDEPHTTAMVDACFTVNKRWLSRKDCPVVAALIKADSNEDTPLKSVYKYEAVIKRAPSDATMVWCFAGLLDLYRSGLATEGELSIRQLNGRGLAGGKGIVDLLVGKHEAALALERKAFEINGFHKTTVSAIARWKQHHLLYRQDKGYKAGETDSTWVSSLPGPDQKFLAIFEDVVFRTLYDVNIKQQKISGSAVSEILERPPIKESIDKIIGELEALGLKKKSTDAPTDGVRDVPGDSEEKKRQLEQQLSEPDPTNVILQPWVELAHTMVHNTCKLVVDPGSNDGICQALQDSAIPKRMEDLKEGEFVVALITQGSMGSSNTRPRYRMVPFRDDFVKRAIMGTCAGLAVTQSDEGVPEKVVICYLDGHIHGNTGRYLKAFTDSKGKALTKEHKQLFLFRTQSSAEEEKTKVKGGVGTTACVEFAHIVSKHPVSCSVIPRLFGAGDNRSDMLGPFTKPAASSNLVLKVAHGDKPGLLGAAMVLVGGAGPSGPAEQNERQAATDIVPMNYHSHGTDELEEFVHALNGKAVVELGSMDGILPYLAVTKGIPYVGFTFSQELKAIIERFVINHVFRAFQTPGHALFQPQMMEAMTKSGIATMAGSSLDPTPKKNKNNDGSADATRGAGSAGGGGDSAKKELMDRLNKLDQI